MTPHIALIGNVNVDMIMGPLGAWPQPGTEVVLPDYELRVGGQAGNAVFALQALGAPFRMITTCGNDVLGRWMQSEFGDAAADWRMADVPTTVSVGITHPNGERTFITNRGHLDVFGPDDILPAIPQQAAEGSMALLVATFLSPPLVASFGRVLDACHRAGYRTALDTGWPPGAWNEAERAAMVEWLPRTDMLLVNEVEALAISGTKGLDHAVPALRRLLPADGTLIVKRGPEGASGYCGRVEAHARAPAVIVADSIGAGDVFNAGFLTAIISGAELQGALERGVAYASGVIATRPRRYRLD